MDIFLVRHGEAAASWGEDPDPGLSELGGQQAVQAAKQLLPLLAPRATTLMSSPLLRAQETAQPIAQALSLPVSVNDAFREIPAPVELGNRKQWLREFMTQQWSAQPEALLDWRESALAAMLALRRPAVIFTHFLVLNAIVGKLQSRSETLVFWPDNASITHLKLQSGVLELVALGTQMETVVN